MCVKSKKIKEIFLTQLRPKHPNHVWGLDKWRAFDFLKRRIVYMFRKAGVDRAVLLGVVTKFWIIIAGAVSLLLIANKFTPQLQGYYYTFFSIISFQFLIELGLGNIIIQFASHEWSGLSLDKAGQIVGEKNALLKLQSLAQLFFHWYCTASIILTLGLGIGGFIFFSRSHDANINWMLPWLSLCICNGALFCLLPIWSLLEGCNQVLKLYSYRLIQNIFFSISFWIAILLGAKLWVITISYVMTLICAGIFLLFRCRIFLKTLLFTRLARLCINWRKDILPLQWRTSIVWMVAPFASNLFVPVLFKYHGPVIAGQMGMTLNIIIAVMAIPSSWLSPRVPQFGMLIAKKNYKDLDKLFWATAKIFAVIAVTVAVLSWFTVYILNVIKHPLAERFLPPLTVGIFLWGQIILILGAPFATYLRVHKKEPLLFLSIAAGISIGSSTIILGKHYSAMGMAVGCLLISLVLTPILFIIWHRCKREWHVDGCAAAVTLNDNIETLAEETH